MQRHTVDPAVLIRAVGKGHKDYLGWANRMSTEACRPQEGESELQEVERQLAKAPVKSGPRDKLAAVDSEAVIGAGFDGNSLKPIPSSNGKVLPAARPAAAHATAVARRLFSPVFLEAFVLTFLAEWGDRSQARSLPTACDNVAESQGGSWVMLGVIFMLVLFACAVETASRDCLL